MTDRTLANWTPPPLPARSVIEGRYARLEPLSPAHIDGLWEAQCEDPTGAMWRYLPTGPHAVKADYAAWVHAQRILHDPVHFAVRMDDGRLGGTLSLMRINAAVGSIETGWLTFAPRLQRTRASTEAVTLLTRWAFEAGYRRFEWKCDAANLPSRRAAQRYGFSFEGVFRQHGIVKGRNRDTAWFAAIDREWPELRAAYDTWLDPSNFDAKGQQFTRLTDLTDPILAARDPILSP